MKSSDNYYVDILFIQINAFYHTWIFADITLLSREEPLILQFPGMHGVTTHFIFRCKSSKYYRKYNFSFLFIDELFIYLNGKLKHVPQACICVKRHDCTWSPCFNNVISFSSNKPSVLLISVSSLITLSFRYHSTEKSTSEMLKIKAQMSLVSLLEASTANVKTGSSVR